MQSEQQLCIFDRHPVASPQQTRDFNGYFQSRNDGSDKWRFYVRGFGRVVDGEHIECSVLMSNGSYTIVPIDAEGRITIDGRKYNQRAWDH